MTDMMRRCAGLVAAGMLVLTLGCAGVQSRRYEFVDRHPAMPIDMKNAVLNGEIVEKMDRDAVRASWGEPLDVVTETGPGGVSLERWVYRKSLGRYDILYEVVFIDGRVENVVSGGYRDEPWGRVWYGVERNR